MQFAAYSGDNLKEDKPQAVVCSPKKEENEDSENKSSAGSSYKIYDTPSKPILRILWVFVPEPNCWKFFFERPFTLHLVTKA